MLIRLAMEPVVKKLAAQFPFVTITGPRRSGKTTLCRAVFPRMPYVRMNKVISHFRNPF